jgi:hypothetical protein
LSDDEASSVGSDVDHEEAVSVAADSGSPGEKLNLLADRSLFKCGLCRLTLKHFSRIKHLGDKHKMTLDAYVKEFGKTEVLRLALHCLFICYFYNNSSKKWYRHRLSRDL